LPRETCKPVTSQRGSGEHDKCYGVSERLACVLGQCRATQRYVVRKGEDRLRHRVIVLSKEYERYDCKRITALLRQDGWRVNHKRVYRFWREEGLKVPSRQPK
jgi:putative transposase